MADMMHHDFFRGLMLGKHNLTTTTGNQLKLALFTSALAPNKDDTVYSATNETSGTGYTAGGANLTKSSYSTMDDDTNDLAYFDADNVTWASSTITARYARLYNDDCTDPADALICTYDFTEDKSSSGGDFTVQFHADGCFKITG